MDDVGGGYAVSGGAAGDRVAVICRLHPVMAGVVFAHLANGDDVSVVDGNIAVAFGPNRHNIDGPVVNVADVDPDAILSAHFNGELVDEAVLAALVCRALERAGTATAETTRGEAPPPGPPGVDGAT